MRTGARDEPGVTDDSVRRSPQPSGRVWSEGEDGYPRSVHQQGASGPHRCPPRAYQGRELRPVAYWPRATLLLLLSLLPAVGCGTLRPAAVAGPAPTGTQGRTLAHEILDIEAPIAGEEGSRATTLLDELLTMATTRVPVPVRPLNVAQQRENALIVLHAIDQLLIERGFVYPLSGPVATFHAGLTSVVFDEDQAKRLKTLPSNERRAAAIDANASRQFRQADCYITCLIYLAIAQKLNLPVAMVHVPGHVFLRWDYTPTGLEPAGHLDFEPTTARETADWMYAKAFGVGADASVKGTWLVGVSRPQTLGYAYARRGQWRCGLGDYASGLDDLRYATFLYGSAPEIKNLLAWTLATCPDARFRDGFEAVGIAQRLVQLDLRANWLDTLACAQAEAGDFNTAIKTELQAQILAATGDEKDRSIDYAAQIEGFRGHATYVQRHSAAGATTMPKQVDSGR